ncbi:DsbA family protein [Leucobacter ruminantium]|uniref:Thioredoxin domain-containing protein n=1 Tax=Leucobacter ruminantium TaxID=1289170 RepID=A0A939LTG1_9MICO|nr:thioredoxin domain-containing protein [Leucobacter ruminantium]MBO1804505.1 thioredoxin domain-containing protein [Leucobacter ruminantium]
MSQTTAQKLRSWSIPVGIIVIAGLLIAVLVLQVKNGSESASADPAASQQEQPDLSYVEARDEADVQSAGPVDAPVGLVVYSDYQCPFCAKWSTDTLPAMMKYAESGDLRIEWRDVVMYGDDSHRAARAAHAAGMQDKFWEFHDALYPDGEHLQPDGLTEDALVQLAGELGLDTDRFATDMNSQETNDIINQYKTEATDLGVSGTPTFVLGGEPIVGAQPESVFVDTFEKKLAEAE